MKEKLTNFKPIVKKIWKSPKKYIVLGIFVVVLISKILMSSYSFYTNQSLHEIFDGTVSIPFNADITLNVFLQDRDADGHPIENSYNNQVYFIPQKDYVYNPSKNVCSETVTELRFDENSHTFTFYTNGKGICDVYFDAIETESVQGSPNAAFRLFVEQNYNSNRYMEVGKIPQSSYSYAVNTEQTKCVNSSGVNKNLCSNDINTDCVEIEVDNESRQLSMTLTSNVTCEIYLKLVNKE